MYSTWWTHLRSSPISTTRSLEVLTTVLQPITIDLEEKLWLCISVDSLSPSHTYTGNSILVQLRSYTLGCSNVVWRCLLGQLALSTIWPLKLSQTSPSFELGDQFVVAFCLHRPDANMVSNASRVVQYVTFAFFGNMEDFLRSKSFSHHMCYEQALVYPVYLKSPLVVNVYSL